MKARRLSVIPTRSQSVRAYFMSAAGFGSFCTSVRARMAEVLADVRAGKFAAELSREEADGYPRLEKAREDNRRTLLEATYRRLSDAGG